MRNEMAQTRLCEVADCFGKYLAKGVCRKHYERLRRNGTLENLELNRRAIAETLAEKTEWRGACLVWTGELNDAGYGLIYRGGKALRVHRVAWLEAGLSLGPDELLDHRCHNRACCNIWHLRPSNSKKNNENRKGANKNSTTGVRNVSPDKKPGMFKVQVTHHRTNHVLSGFNSIEQAAEAAAALREELFEGAK